MLEPLRQYWLRVRHTPGLVLFIVLYQQVTIGCTFSIITLALPILAEELDVGESIIVWVFFMPQLVAGMLSIPLGRAADMYGRKRMWFAGCLVHLLSMGLSGTANSAAALIAARAITGIGQSLEGPCGGAIAMSVYPKSKRGYVISWSTIMNTLAASMGMVLGGVLLKFMPWRILFLGNAPLVLAVLPLAWVVLPDSNDPVVLNGDDNEDKGDEGEEVTNSKDDPTLPFDWQGALLLCLLTCMLLLGFNRAGPWGWGNSGTLGLLAAGCFLLPLFTRHQLSMGKGALLPALFLRDPVIRLTTIMRLLLGAVYMIAFLLLPYYLQLAQGYSTDEAASLLFIRPLFFSLSSYFVGRKCESMR